MNSKEANEIISMFEYYEDKSCICFQGNPPCGKCVNCPSEELYKDALKKIMEKQNEK